MHDNLPITWLKNGILALAISGIYSIALVILRTPQLSHLFSDKSVFQSALIIHVNLSVLVWMLSITCVFWSYSSIKSGFEKIYAYIAIASTVLMSISPIFFKSNPIMNNYVPMLENICFILGLSLFLVIILFFALQTIVISYIEYNSKEPINRIFDTVKITSALIFVFVCLCFSLSYFSLKELIKITPIQIDYFYEMLFWSGGHLLQFIYSQILMVVVFILCKTALKEKIKYTSLYEMFFILNFILSLTIFFGHYKYEIEHPYFKGFFTKHMIYTAGIAPSFFILTLLFEIVKSKTDNSVAFIKSSFFASSFLFLSGGFIGCLISGANVTIPAHYHGSIVGISISFMGFAYLMCFSQYKTQIFSNQIIKIEKKDYYYVKLANLQIITISIGQILHISGLALAGGYGVLRKTPGKEIEFSAKIYMSMVGIGGLLAIIGGLIFVYICGKKLHSLKSDLYT